MENNEPDKSQQMFAEVISGMKAWRASLDQIEIWFSVLQRKCLQPSHFVSTPALETALTDYIAYSNQTAKPIN